MHPFLNKVRGKVKGFIYCTGGIENLQNPVHKLRVARVLDVEAPFVVALLAIELIGETNSAGDDRATPSINDAWLPFAARIVAAPDGEVNEVAVTAKTRSQELTYIWEGFLILE